MYQRSNLHRYCIVIRNTCNNFLRIAPLSNNRRLVVGTNMLKKSSQSLRSLFILLAVTLQCCSCFSVDNIQWKEVKIPVQNNDGNNNIETFKNIQRKKMLNGKVPVSSRLVPLGIEGVPFVTIWELQNPSKLMEMWWAADMDSSSSVSKEKIGDPFVS